jgi:hypothetical protein
MAGRDYLGEFEHIVVLALLRLEERAYGVTVRQEIELRTRREVSIGAVYATLDRLTAANPRRNVADVRNASFVSQLREWRL